MDLENALLGCDNTRASLSILKLEAESLADGPVKNLLLSKIGKWRNLIKASLTLFLECFLFPLKKLGVHGRKYFLWLEDFANPTIGTRHFTVHCKRAGFEFGDDVLPRHKLMADLEKIDHDIDICCSISSTMKATALAPKIAHSRIP